MLAGTSPLAAVPSEMTREVRERDVMLGEGGHECDLDENVVGQVR